MYFAGLDAGQSSTTAVIATSDGHVLARGSGPPADEVAQGPESTRMRDALSGALAAAVAAAGLGAATRFASVVAGISGYEGRVFGREPSLPSDRVSLVHDSVIAHAGALQGAPGVVVIAGTGSVGYAVNDAGLGARVGGWGYLFGDEGSAFWLARSALGAIMSDSEGHEPSSLAKAALEHFKQPSLRALARVFYAGEITRAELATFARPLTNAASRGDAEGVYWVREAAEQLALLAYAAAGRAGLGEHDAAFVGGLMR
ncbi:MAG: hypothetical protein M3Z07_03710, partial [Candidatus Eremiobacteraeota bacterium]|nr:hypothetical protein [Candidatus Eremiobacteraeota bacterium]